MNAAKQNRTRRAYGQQGFSLIEILIVVALIAGIMGLVATQFSEAARAPTSGWPNRSWPASPARSRTSRWTPALPQRLEDLVTEPGNAKDGSDLMRGSRLQRPLNTQIEYRVPGEGTRSR